ncbi:hypothetical protein RMB13_02100 [Acinetobacter sp. V102_4]|uniref:hypothetical protein n=1 Tax=Acinetobacter sp. V102_4 TaxID=3072984 RepID=UPI00287D4458|nr:hypothetical protein [Acinetobacter sp. V102_4]MDS7928284.1 hypothetical protein [Acinetobacter sp. V102_4]
MKELMLIVVFPFCFFLVGCDVGSNIDESSTSGSSSVLAGNTELLGIYRGNLNGSQSVIGLVDKNNKFRFLYSVPGQKNTEGLITGIFNMSGNTIRSLKGRNYNFGGTVSYNTLIKGTVDTKKSLKGTVNYPLFNQAVFVIAYDDVESQNISKLTKIVGSYTGKSISVHESKYVNLTISRSGLLSGKDQNGCAFAGMLTPEPYSPYYNVKWYFDNTLCNAVEKQVNGIAYSDSKERILYVIVEDTSQENTVVFLGSKTGIQI